MLANSSLWIAFGLIFAGAEAFNDPAVHLHPLYPPSSHSLTHGVPDANTQLPVSSIWYSATTIGNTSTCTSEDTIPSPLSTKWYTESTTARTTTIHAPPLKSTTTSILTLSTQSTFFTTVSTTTTTTSTTYVPTTVTPAPSPPNPCPTTCSISAGTVNLYYWPSNEANAYPSTYVNTHLDYTFTSPSVYMIVDTIYGYNTAGRAGPSGTSVVFPLDLDQVSTIVPYVSVTKQLTLSDLGTDCPQTEAASVIATAAPNGRCDPILAAPKHVKSWASPCNACGNFGLFDPPYAVPPLTGGLIADSTTSMTQSETQTTPSTVSATDTTDTTSTSMTPEATLESSSEVAETTSTYGASESISSEVVATTDPVALSSTARPGASSASSFTSSPSPSTSSVMYAAATKPHGGLFGLVFSFLAAVYLL